MATPPPPGAPDPPPGSGAPLPSLGLAALIVSALCTAWVAVEILLRIERAPEWMITGSFAIAILLALVVVVLAYLAARQDRRRGGMLGLLAVATAAGDRIVLAVFSAFGGF